jgi:spore germination protein YaaH
MIHPMTQPRRPARLGDPSVRSVARGAGVHSAGLALLAMVAILAGACDSGSGSTPRADSGAPTGSGSGPAVHLPAASAGSVVDGQPSTAESSGPGDGGASPPSERPIASPPSDPVGPATGQPPATAYDPAKFGFAAKGLRGEVMAFVTTSQVDDALARLDFEATSTIAFFSLVAGSSGAINQDTRWRSWNGAQVDRLIARAHATGTKVVISLARFSWSPAQTKASVGLLSSETARARLARAVADEVVRRGIDGVNVDFEPIPSGQRANFTDLVRRIRRELDARGPGYQLTFDVVGHFESYDVGGALQPGGADAVYLMGYHYAGTFSTIAHGTAPLGGSRYSVADAIRGLRTRAKPWQLIVGVPYYGHLWPTVSGALNARTTAAGYDVPYSSARLIGARRGTIYDPIEQVQRVAWRGRSCATCPVHWFQLYFDDARSLGAKWTEFQRQGLLGTGVWTSAFEGESGDLSAALRTVWLVGG